jgi:transposase
MLVVWPPSPDDEDCRWVCRERKSLIVERVAHVNRIKGLLFSSGMMNYQPRSAIGDNCWKSCELATDTRYQRI